MKYIVYGSTDTGKHALADRLWRDNKIDREPIEVRSPESMAMFLQQDGDAIAVVHSTTADLIYRRYDIDREQQGIVLLAAPGMIEGVSPEISIRRSPSVLRQNAISGDDLPSDQLAIMDGGKQPST